jgi:hypothetical protein
VLVRKGTYQEPTLEINKSVSLIGEDVDETTLNLNPPLVETWFLRNKLWFPTTGVEINADDFRLHNFTINIARGDYGEGGGFIAKGDNMEIINSKITNNGINLNGSFIKILNNSITSPLEIIGSNQTIKDNSLQHLKIQGSFNQITSNKINSQIPIHGIDLSGSFNLISGNSLSRLAIGGRSNVVVANSLEGLALNGPNCSDNLIAKNKVSWAEKAYPIYNGVSISYCTNNTITVNIIRDCDHGLRLSGTVTNNSIYLNNFMNNSVNIEYYRDANWTLDNHFDNGVKGNYYDDYKGADGNWDGIGDVPFIIEGTRWDSEADGVVSAGFSQDRYPLMYPYDVDSVNIELPEWASGLLNSSTDPQTSHYFPVMPIVTVTVMILALIAVGLLVYFKKRKH